VSTTRRFIAGSALIAALLYFALDTIYPHFLSATYRSGLAFGIAVTLIHCASSFFLLSWGGRQGDKRFLGAFAGSLLGRLALIGIATYVAYRIPTIDFRTTLFTLVIAFFPLTGYEVYCVVRGLDAGSARRPAAGTAPTAAQATPAGRGA